MATVENSSREATGARFSPEAMLHARELSMQAVQRIAAQVRPGMTAEQAKVDALETLRGMGMDRIWHPVIIRFGEDTLKRFNERGDPQRVLGERDIFFIDIGPVWRGHEGDAGGTFTVGGDAQMQACADAAHTLWQDVARHWRTNQVSGQALYAYAEQRAASLGWKLNLEIKGHRVSDFPHAIYKAGDLGDFSQCPGVGLWILEIQIAHPTLPFGAFYEDLLY